VLGALALSLSPVSARGAPALTPQQILDRSLETDAWGGGDTEVQAHADIKPGHGAPRTLVFTARSRRYDPPLTKTLIRFTAPGSLKGTGLLQIQNKEGDDDRFLFLPELKRSRRIAGGARDSAFMGTDFSYADLDRKDLRHSRSKLLGEERLGKADCFHLEAVPVGAETVYARIELWVSKDNFIPLKLVMYNRAGAATKTLLAQELRRVSGRWFITRSLMTTAAEGSSTQLVLDKITLRPDLPDADFTVSNLEKL
jgi:hypothetical protein